MSGPRVNPQASQNVRYRERLRVPWWWWPLGFVAAALIAYEVVLGARGLPAWLPFAALFAVTVAVLLWLGRVEVEVRFTDGAGGTGAAGSAGRDGEVELRVGEAHLPVSAIGRCAEIPSSAKSAALGRQLDPAAYVVHRGWVGPMVLLVLDDPDDPTPYWLVSCRRPQRVLAALKD